MSDRHLVRSDLACVPEILRRTTKFGGLIAVLLMFGLFLATAFAQPAQATDYSTEELEFVNLLNDYRVSNGLEPLLVSDLLSEAADRHCSDMAKYHFFDHYTTGGSDWFPVGSSPWDRMAACGYDIRTSKGENLAAGQDSAAAVFEDWKNSPGHNANMLAPDFAVLGIAYIRPTGADHDAYWATDFGGNVDETAHTAGPPATNSASPASSEPAEATTEQPATSAPSSQTPSVPAAPATPLLGFSDVGPDTPYADDIAYLAALGIICGYEDGTFGPADPITRQQFAKMIALTLGYDIQPVTASGFDDVELQLGQHDALYPAGYIAACLKAGIVQGKADGSFGPFDKVTRAQLITMVARAAGLADSSPTAQPPFADFSPDHYPWAAKAWAAGLLDGISGMGADYGFWADASRGEACVLLCNLLELTDTSTD